MSKITPEMMAAYLPHSLDLYGASDIWSLYSVSYGGVCTILNGGHIQKIDLDNIGVEYAPILLPIEAMPTYEFGGGGDPYTACQMLYEFNNSLGKERFDAEEVKTMCKTGGYSYYVFQQMLAMNIDVFGLIEKGLAVDIRSLNL